VVACNRLIWVGGGGGQGGQGGPSSPARTALQRASRDNSSVQALVPCVIPAILVKSNSRQCGAVEGVPPSARRPGRRRRALGALENARVNAETIPDSGLRREKRNPYAISNESPPGKTLGPCSMPSDPERHVIPGLPFRESNDAFGRLNCTARTQKIWKSRDTVHRVKQKRYKKKKKKGKKFQE
jgi:hypothetical protein